MVSSQQVFSERLLCARHSAQRGQCKEQKSHQTQEAHGLVNREKSPPAATVMRESPVTTMWCS